MKTIREVLVNLLPQARPKRAARLLKPALALAMAFTACAAAAAPANDNFANAFVISGVSGITNGDNTAATLEEPCEPLQVNTDDNGSQFVTNSVWFAWTAPATGPVEFDTIGSSFDTVLSVWTSSGGICGVSPVTADDNTGGNVDFSGETSLVEFNATAGTTYYISVNSDDDGSYTASGGFGPYVLDWNSTPANDNFANAWMLTGVSGTTNGNNTLATLELGETNILNTYNPDGSVEFSPDYVTNSVWFVWTATKSGALEVDTAGSDFETILGLWTTTNGLGSSLTNVLANDAAGSIDGFTAQLTYPVVAGTTYYISLESYDGIDDPSALASFDVAGAYVLNWSFSTNTVVGSPPSLVSGPFSFTAATYTVDQDDSTQPNNILDGTTVNPSLLGARVTVTRPAPAYGKVLVDYTVGDTNFGLTYLYTFTTNYWGTNVLTTITSTDIPPIVTISNSYSTNLVINNFEQQYDRGYVSYVFFEVETNTATQVYNLAYSNSTTSAGTFSIPTNPPILGSFQLSSTVVSGGFTITSTTNVFGFVQNFPRVRGQVLTNGLTFTNQSVVFTNLVTLFTNTPVNNFLGRTSCCFVPVNSPPPCRYFPPITILTTWWAEWCLPQTSSTRTERQWCACSPSSPTGACLVPQWPMNPSSTPPIIKFLSVLS